MEKEQLEKLSIAELWEEQTALAELIRQDIHNDTINEKLIDDYITVAEVIQDILDNSAPMQGNVGWLFTTLLRKKFIF